MSAVLDKAEVATQYILKSRVHELPEGLFRGYVDVTTRSPAGRLESRLRYCPLLRHTWDEAITDAERMAESAMRNEYRDGEVSIFSARTTSSFDTVMNILAARIRL
ncbi:hypothetical protein GCM10023144_20900 [Pigmentiphaga soli]|uniref:Uncharacterized protein n=1 Tax=Pigmentiphaga soli TaxID=1007095 RepID=A0ABP8GYJ2_9BURK